MSFKDDWKATNKKEHRNWIIQTTFIVIFGIIGIALALTFANSSPLAYPILIPTIIAVGEVIFLSKLPWRETTNKTGSEDK